jgi:hypothetical protein
MDKRKFKIALAVFLLSYIAVLVVTKVLPYYKFKNYEPAAGDLVFQSLPYNDLVLAIEGISESPYSHCGIVVNRNGEWYVLEAIGPVKYTPLYDWVDRGREASFVAYRFSKTYKIGDFIKAAESYLGKPYDSQYEMDDEKIYCSELIYKAFLNTEKIKLGDMKALGQMPWESYEKTIRKYEGGAPPLDRLMITPVNLSKAAELELFYKQNY